MTLYLHEHRRRLLLALGVALYLKFLLIPTGVVFYELHHLTGIDGVYWGYSLFKGAGYYFGIWPWQNLACIGVALLIAVPWRRTFRLLNNQRPKTGATA